MKKEPTRIVRVGMAQINTTVGDLSGNTEKILKVTKKAKQEGVSILSFPEMSITGYPPEDLLLDRMFVKENQEHLARIARETEGIISIVGFVDGEATLYNAAAIIANRSIVGVYRKIALPNYGVFDEKRYFHEGKSFICCDIEDICFTVTICEDIWVEDSISLAFAKKMGIPLIFNISSSPYDMKKMKVRERLLKDRAKEHSAAFVYTNLVGGQDELVFDGGSMAIDSSGGLIVKGKRFSEELVILDLEVPTIDPLFLPRNKDCQGQNDGFSSKLIDLGGAAPCFFRSRKEIIASSAKEMLLNEEIYQALVLGTRDYIIKNRFKKAVIGLSGGIDSSLTAAIAVDALSPSQVTGVIMPSPYSSKESEEDAKQLAENLGISCHTIAIESIMGVYADTLKDVFNGWEQDTTEENIQARIRGNILMALSNKFGWLVLTTGNKSEIGVGYCTLYGDMSGGFAVIKDVPKTIVYLLSQHRNDAAGYDLIPKNVLSKAPSAELRPGQKDEDSLPPYSALDSILQAYIEENKTIEEINRMGYDFPLICDVIKMVDRNEYKRRQGPPGIKITRKAFGRDRRYPITNRYMRKRLERK